MNPETKSARVQYKKPPIIERVLRVVGDIAPESFFAKFEAWREAIQPSFPDYEPLKDWRLNIEVKDGVPVFTDALPQVIITHHFSRKSPQGKKLLSMRIMPNEIALHLHRDPEKPHYFEELFTEAETLVPQWFTHFGVKASSSVALDYINLLSPATTPSFVRANGILVSSMLTVFSGVPSQHYGIIPPYDCQMGLMIDPQRPATFSLRVLGLITPQQHGPAIRVDFHSEVTKDSPRMSAQQVLAETQFLHTVIVDQFESLFTKEAKQTFEPI
jgi:hypothetical protein